MENEKRVRQAAFRVAFLMPHQKIGSVIKLESMALMPVNEEIPVNKESPEYLAGANDALMYLIEFLKGKGE